MLEEYLVAHLSLFVDNYLLLITNFIKYLLIFLAFDATFVLYWPAAGGIVQTLFDQVI
ncbi:hypothetical protein CFter6_3974 [Collimonas fungivorans]|uniref:Uncharacterized protein n=1 Tax=Collimonas fungivorans TaxID=158899 RepID=A0A127PFL3_9BURK|nr:hypothetical protein CFter6_3974 [Collimonas fungivorans]